MIVCPTSGTVIPAGQSAIQFDHPILAVLLLTIRIDGQLVELDGDGVAIVTPGLHTWEISNADDTEVLASGEVECPECSTASPSVSASPAPSTVPPAPPAPPSVPNTSLPLAQGIAWMAGVAVMTLGGLLFLNERSVRRRQ